MEKFNFKQIGMRAAGAAAGGVGSNLVSDMFSKLDPKLLGVAKIAVGCIIPEIAPKSKFAEAAGIGLAAGGSADLYGAFTKKEAPAVTGTGVQDVTTPEYNVDDDYRVTGTNAYVFGTENNALAGNQNDALAGNQNDAMAGGSDVDDDYSNI